MKLLSLLFISTLSFAQEIVVPTQPINLPNPVSANWDKSILGELGLYKPSPIKGTINPYLDSLPSSTLIVGSELIKTYRQMFPTETAPTKQSLEQSFAVLALQKIMDQKAALLKLDNRVPEERVYYIMRAMLTRNAVRSGHVPTITDEKTSAKTSAGNISSMDLNKMYEWFSADVKKAIAQSSTPDQVYFQSEISWNYGDGGLKTSLDAMTASDVLVWPKVLLRFEYLPQDLNAFKAEIVKQTAPVYTSLRTQYVWNQIAGHYSVKAAGVRKRPTFMDISKLYAAIAPEVKGEMKAQGIEGSFELSDRKVQDALYAHIFKNQELFMVREALFKLFSENTYFPIINICMDSKWPCIDTSPASLAEGLVQEELYAGESLGSTRTQLRKTTLGSTQDFPKIKSMKEAFQNFLTQ